MMRCLITTFISQPKGNRIVLVFLFLFIGGTNVLFAEDPVNLKKFLRKTTTWECKTLNAEVPVNI